MEIARLRGMLTRRGYELISPHIARDMLSPNETTIIKWIENYYKRNPTLESVTPSELGSYIKLRAAARSTPEQLQAVLKQVERLEGNPPKDINALTRLSIEQGVIGKAQAAIERYHNGSEVDPLEELEEILDSARHYLSLMLPPPAQLTLAETFELEYVEGGITLSGIPAISEHVQNITKGDSIGFAGRPGIGKCQAPDTPILMYDGSIKLAKDVVVGDKLASPNGYNTVTSTTSGRSEMFEIKYAWGESYTVNDVHILSLKRSKAEGKHKHGDILNVPLNEYLTWSKGRKERYKGWKTGVEFPTKVQLLPPYLLGAWLGDGTATKPDISTSDYEVISEFIKYYGEPSRVYDGITHSFTRTPLRDDLRALGVLGNKHIPQNYLTGDRQQRLELLAGLLDTDGHNFGKGYEILVKDTTLSQQIVYLARSLGIHATSKPKFSRATNSTHEGSWYTRIILGREAHVVPCRVPRKQLTVSSKPYRKGLQFGFEVESKGMGDYVGWTLDGDRLYLLGDFTVTHNTSSLAALLTSSAVNISNYFNDDSRKIHWLQNEGGLNKSRARVFQAGLRMTRDEVLEALKADQNALEDLFLERVGKPHDYFHFASIAGWDTAKVERYIRDHRPSVVVIDMLQHISIRGGEGETEKIKMLWEWVRLMAIQYDCVVISTIQVGESGDNKPYPELADLYYSRTAVQSAVDVMLIMGFVNRPDMADIRFYSSPKNKRKVTGKPENFQAQAVVDLDRCVFDGVYYE